MSYLESITELLKAYAWPIFLFIIILLFKDPIFKIGAFFRELIKSRGLKGKYKNSEILIPPDDPETTKQRSVDEVRDKVFSSLSLSSSYVGVDESIIMGFGVVSTKDFEIAGNLNIHWNPDMKTVNGNHYEIGQRVYFAIKNISDIEFRSPLCAVQFPSTFTHLSTESPETGKMTINSDLWGIGGASTELRDLNSGITEISAFLGRVLRPGQLARFFIRLNIPNEKGNFKLIMKFRTERKDEIHRELNLIISQGE